MGGRFIHQGAPISGGLSPCLAPHHLDTQCPLHHPGLSWVRCPPPSHSGRGGWGPPPRTPQAALTLRPTSCLIRGHTPPPRCFSNSPTCRTPDPGLWGLTKRRPCRGYCRIRWAGPQGTPRGVLPVLPDMPSGLRAPAMQKAELHPERSPRGSADDHGWPLRLPSHHRGRLHASRCPRARGRRCFWDFLENIHAPWGCRTLALMGRGPEPASCRGRLQNLPGPVRTQRPTGHETSLALRAGGNPP